MSSWRGQMWLRLPVWANEARHWVKTMSLEYDTELFLWSRTCIFWFRGFYGNCQNQLECLKIYMTGGCMGFYHLCIYMYFHGLSCIQGLHFCYEWPGYKLGATKQLPLTSHLDITHPSVHMTRRFVIQDCPTLSGTVVWVLHHDVWIYQ